RASRTGWRRRSTSRVRYITSGWSTIRWSNAIWLMRDRLRVCKEADGVGRRAARQSRAESNGIDDHTPDHLPGVHLLERGVDLLERAHLGDVLVELYPPLHVLVDELRHLGASLHAAERGAAPRPPGHEQER